MNASQIFLAFSVGAGILAGLLFGIAIGRGRREKAIREAESVARALGRTEGRAEGYGHGRTEGYAAGCAEMARRFAAERRPDAATSVMTVVPDHTTVLPRQPAETATFARPPIQSSWRT